MRFNCMDERARLKDIEYMSEYFKRRGDAVCMTKQWNDRRQAYDRILNVREIEVR